MLVRKVNYLSISGFKYLSLIMLLTKQIKCLTLDVELLPGLAAHHHDGDAGRDAGEQQVQHPALPEVLRRVVDLAAPAPVAEAA